MLRTFGKIFDAIASLTFVFIMIIVLYQVIARYLFNIGVAWIEEVSRLFYVYMAFFGAAISLRDGQSIVIDTIPNLAPPKIRFAMGAFSDVMCVTLLVLLFLGTLKMARMVWPTTLSTLDFVSNGWMYLAGAISFGYMIVIKVQQLFIWFFDRKGGKTA